MRLSRRNLLKGWASLAATRIVLPVGLTGCSSARPLAALLRSEVPLPPEFQVELPILPVLKAHSNAGDADRYELSAKETKIEILPGLKTTIWGYDGRFPGPTIEAWSGRKTVVTLHNELPVPIVNHLHGGRTPCDSDGYPTDIVHPKENWTPVHMHDPRAKTAAVVRDYVYPNQQRAATLWYHDHRMDFTGPQMWRGLAGMYILRDDEDDRLPLPKGDKDVSLMICDRSFGKDGSFLYPSLDPSLRQVPGVSHSYMGGVLGDVILVNGAPWPRFEVATTAYRVRILNACNARHLELSLDPAPKDGPAFVQIGSDGGLLASPVQHKTLPIAPAERFDLILDFSRYPLGSKVVLRNKESDGPAGAVMRFDVARQEKSESNIPKRLAQFNRLDRRDAVITRFFDFSYEGMKRGWLINGRPFDPARMDAQPKLGSTEIWRLRSDMHHPLHIHLAHFQVLTHAGHPRSYDSGWKDTIDMVAGETAEVLVRFEGYRGRYVFHCHNLEHEDMAMMGNFEVV